MEKCHLPGFSIGEASVEDFCKGKRNWVTEDDSSICPVFSISQVRAEDLHLKSVENLNDKRNVFQPSAVVHSTYNPYWAKTKFSLQSCFYKYGKYRSSL